MVFDLSTLKKFPAKPGVYLMKDLKEKVIYVGKAKNLRQRVRQYFIDGGDSRPMIPFLRKKVESIETIIVLSEKEALLLENNLIKQHRPKYNVLLKDDKTYVSLKINAQHAWPMVQIARLQKKRSKDSALYFGPYTSGFAAKEVLNIIKKCFQLRSCSDQELARRKRPCILYQMERCLAPCVNYCTQEQYKEHLQQVVILLKGQIYKLLSELQAQMEQASKNLEFEKAGHFLLRVRAIEKLLEKQNVDRIGGEDQDAFAVYREASEGVVVKLIFRGGKLLSLFSYPFKNVLQEDQPLLVSFLLQHYAQEPFIPKEILLPFELEEQAELQQILREEKGKIISLLTPKKGDRKKIIQMAQENAVSIFQKEQDAKQKQEEMLLDLQEKLHLFRFPQRIECFDNSHTAGAEPVSSMVVFVDGEPARKEYRKYKIKQSAAGDDYGMMSEVLERRYRKAKESSSLPDLIIIDGGKGQLSATLSILQTLDITTIDVIALVKEEGRHDKGETLERAFLPERKDAVHFKKNSKTLYLLQRIRDEAHRFVIEFHRKRMKKKMGHSLLDQVVGIGKIKKQRLLKTFGSLKNIFSSSEEQLKRIPGLTVKDIENLKKLKMEESERKK